MDEIRKIRIELPADRRGIGNLRLLPKAIVGSTSSQSLQTGLPQIPCIGKADNARAADKGNPYRDPIRPFGDTPFGLYKPAPILRLEPTHARMGSYFLPLDGTAGEALKAASNGRNGLGIHGGRGDRLVPTYGCIRLRDRDMAALAEAVGDCPVEVAIRVLR